MKTYIVEVECRVRNITYIEAESEQKARERAFAKFKFPDSNSEAVHFAKRVVSSREAEGVSQLGSAEPIVNDFAPVPKGLELKKGQRVELNMPHHRGIFVVAADNEFKAEFGVWGSVRLEGIDTLYFTHKGDIRRSV